MAVCGLGNAKDEQVGRILRDEGVESSPDSGALLDRLADRLAVAADGLDVIGGRLVGQRHAVAVASDVVRRRPYPVVLFDALSPEGDP